MSFSGIIRNGWRDINNLFYISMRRKKILFVIPEYSIGGTNTSLANLLSLIDHERYDVSILSLYEDGTEHFKSLFRPYIIRKSLLYTLVHDNVVTRKFMGLCLKFSKKASWEWIYRYEAWRIRRKHHFDVVVGFQEGLATNFVLYFKDVYRVAWFHSPYIEYVTKNHNYYWTVYKQYDAIACVSNHFVSLFSNTFPDLSNRLHCIYNTLNVSVIQSMSDKKNHGFHFEKDIFSIVSIGRLCEQKCFHLIPKMAAEIRDAAGNCFRWYIVGEGADRKRIEEEVRKHDVGDCVVLLGAKDNPYPFLREADLYVCTSESESFSYTIAEAKILHTPVLSNNFPVAYEVLDDSTGWVMPNDEMPGMIARLIRDEDGCYSRVKKSIASYVYDNQAILDKLYNMITV